MRLLGASTLSRASYPRTVISLAKKKPPKFTTLRAQFFPRSRSANSKTSIRIYTAHARVHLIRRRYVYSNLLSADFEYKSFFTPDCAHPFPHNRACVYYIQVKNGAFACGTSLRFIYNPHLVREDARIRSR